MEFEITADTGFICNLQNTNKENLYFSVIDQHWKWYIFELALFKIIFSRFELLLV